MGWFLVILLIATIVFIVVATARYALYPFLVLLAAAYGLGLLAGLSPSEVVSAIRDGFGGTIGGIGIIIAAGTIIGVVLERSGGAQVMADTIIRMIGKARAVMAMSLTGAVVSVPVFYDSGFVILAPLGRSLTSKSGRSMATYAVAGPVDGEMSWAGSPLRRLPLRSASSKNLRRAWLQRSALVTGLGSRSPR